jgi:nucleoside-diphosphate-sugar epimerase
MSEVLITGGAGFIGSHLARRCLAQGNTVHILVRPQTSLFRLQGLGGSLHIHTAELTDRDAMMRLGESIKPQWVFHLAARTRRTPEPDLSDVAASVTEDLLVLTTLLSCFATSASPPRAFIRSGSLAEYGSGHAPASEEQREMPLNAYAAALSAGTHYLQMLRPRLPFPAITARLALVYGPQQDEDFFVPQLIRKCLTRQSAEVRYPSDRRDILFVDDACEALIRLAAQLPDVSLVNISTGVAPSMRELALLIAKETAADPASIMFGAEHGTGGIPDFRASPALLHSVMDWRPRFSPDEGIRRCVAWHREQLREVK